MSIASQITALSNNISSAYNMIGQRGGTVPARKNAENMATAIATIPSGGGGEEEKPVKFYNFDGSVVAQYTNDEAASLAALPQVSSSTYSSLFNGGLEFAGWTETLSYINSQGAQNEMAIGAIYQWADDHNASAVEFSIFDGGTVTLNVSQTNANDITIDWGDNSAQETLETAGEVTVTHTYTTGGKYVIVIYNNGTDKIYLGKNNSSSNMVFFNKTSGYPEISVLVGAAHIGKQAFYRSGTNFFNGWINVLMLSPQAGNIQQQSFASDASGAIMGCVIIPSNVTDVSHQVFYQTYLYGGVVLPSSITIGTSAFESVKILDTVIINGTNTILGTNIFQACTSLKKVYLPKNYDKAFPNVRRSSLSGVIDYSEYPNISNTINSTTFEEVSGISKFIISSRITTIQRWTFGMTAGKEQVIVFKNRSSMPSFQSAFSGNGWIYWSATTNVSIEFPDATQVPSMSTSNADNFFANMPDWVEIRVPRSLEASWKTATGWSTRANQIKGVF